MESPFYLALPCLPAAERIPPEERGERIASKCRQQSCGLATQFFPWESAALRSFATTSLGPVGILVQLKTVPVVGRTLQSRAQSAFQVLRLAPSPPTNPQWERSLSYHAWCLMGIFFPPLSKLWAENQVWYSWKPSPIRPFSQRSSPLCPAHLLLAG